MTIELIDLAVGLISGSTALVVGRFWGRRATKVSGPREQYCSGYRFGRGVVCKMMDDCTALRSADCKDGRCTYHCEDMCKCITALGLR